MKKIEKLIIINEEITITKKNNDINEEITVKKKKKDIVRVCRYR